MRIFLMPTINRSLLSLNGAGWTLSAQMSQQTPSSPAVPMVRQLTTDVDQLQNTVVVWSQKTS